MNRLAHFCGLKRLADKIADELNQPNQFVSKQFVSKHPGWSHFRSISASDLVPSLVGMKEILPES
jgi:hypothetical protein